MENHSPAVNRKFKAEIQIEIKMRKKYSLSQVTGKCKFKIYHF